MTSASDAEWIAFKREIVRMANANDVLMDGTTGPLKRIIDGAEVVYAVWQDHDEPDGVGMLTVKGQRNIMECVASGQPIEAAVNAFTCTCAEQAFAARQVFGTPPADA